MLTKDIAEMMKLIQRDESKMAEKIKADGPSLKGELLITGESWDNYLLVLFST